MKNRKNRFNEETAAARARQAEELAGYIEEYIALNSDIRNRKFFNPPTEEQYRRIAEMPLPQKGRDIREVSYELVHDILDTSALLQHPRFFSFVCSAVSPFALAGALLTDVYNPNASSRDLSPMPCLIEEKMIDWMGSRAGYPESRGGTFVSGGSMANLTALVAARDARLSEDEFGLGVAYVSDQTHCSVAKNLRISGIRSSNIIVIPSDDSFRMRIDLLEEHITADINAGLKPYVIIGTLGTTNTGSVDPLDRIADIAGRYGLWFHVDGAFGGSVLISDIYRNLASGIEKSDSLSWDTHKWMLQPYSCSSVIVRDRNTLINAFAEHPEYLEDIRREGQWEPWDLSPELSRPARAVKLWFTVQTVGLDTLADIIDYSFYNTNVARDCFDEMPDWKIIVPPVCGVINVRYSPDGYTEEQLDKINDEISRRIISDGFAYIVTTVLKGRKVLRISLINASTDMDDIIDTVRYLNRLAEKITAG